MHTVFFLMLKHSYESPARRCRRRKQRSKSQCLDVSSISGGDGGGGCNESTRGGGTIDDHVDENHTCFPFNWQPMSSHASLLQQDQQDDDADYDNDIEFDDQQHHHNHRDGNNARFQSRNAVKMTRRRPPSGAASSVDSTATNGSVRRWNSFHSTRGECHPNKFRRDRKSTSPSIDGGGSTGCLGSGRRTAESSPMRHGGSSILSPPRRYKSLAAGGSCELAAALFNEVSKGANARRRVTTPIVLEAHW